MASSCWGNRIGERRADICCGDVTSVLCFLRKWSEKREKTALRALGYSYNPVDSVVAFWATRSAIRILPVRRPVRARVSVAALRWPVRVREGEGVCVSAACVQESSLGVWRGCLNF